MRSASAAYTAAAGVRRTAVSDSALTGYLGTSIFRPATKTRGSSWARRTTASGWTMTSRLVPTDVFVTCTKSIIAVFLFTTAMI